jgi:hypothetical protein
LKVSLALSFPDMPFYRTPGLMTSQPWRTLKAAFWEEVQTQDVERLEISADWHDKTASLSLGSTPVVLTKLAAAS